MSVVTGSICEHTRREALGRTARRATTRCFVECTYGAIKRDRTAVVESRLPGARLGSPPTHRDTPSEAIAIESGRRLVLPSVPIPRTNPIHDPLQRIERILPRSEPRIELQRIPHTAFQHRLRDGSRLAHRERGELNFTRAFSSHISPKAWASVWPMVTGPLLRSSSTCLPPALARMRSPCQRKVIDTFRWLRLLFSNQLHL